MDGPADLGRAALEFVLAVVEPLETAAEDPAAAAELLALAGWDLEAVPGLGVDRITAAAGALTDVVTALREVLHAPDAEGTDLAAVADLAGRVGLAVARLGAFADGWSAPTDLPADLPVRLLEDLLGVLVALAVGRLHPALRSTLDLLGVLHYPDTPAIARADGRTVRPGGSRVRFDVDALGRLLADPAGALLSRFGLTGPGRLPADAAADQVLPAVAALLRDLGLAAWYGVPPGVPLSDAQRRLLAHTLRVGWDQVLDGATTAHLDAVVTLRDDGPHREVLVVPTGSLAASRTVGTWTARAAMTGQVGGLVIRADGVHGGGGVPPRLRLDGELRRPTGATPLARLGAADGPRFEVAAAELTAFVEFGDGPPRGGWQLDLTGVRLTVAAPPGDGFLGSLLPPEGLTASCDLTLAWTPDGGLRLAGSAALDVTVPLGLAVGPVRLDSAYLAVRATGGQVALLGTVSTTLTLGPVTAVVERFGVRAALTAAPHGGSIGAADLTVGFAPPSGVALAVDAGPVRGGGYVFHDEARHLYAGLLQLAIGDTLTLTAIGLITTQMADGSPGFSLLVIVSAQGFTPIQLGMGFTLTGIGGLLGINRGSDVAALRQGVRAGTLGAVLFPDDPVRNAPAIVSAVDHLFPARRDHYVLGPMALLAWGTPTLLTLRLALLLEFPSPTRVLLLGRLQAVLPDEQHPAAVVRMDALGVLDLDRSELAIDATLYDSRIGGFTASGDMALRLGWGAQPQLLLAVGGYHPRFTAPAGFPALRRISLALADSDNPRLRLDAYLAVTSNTVQFGAHLDLYAAAGGFSVEGHLGFDALVQLSPFQLQVDLAATVALRYQGSTLLAVLLQVSLSGPTPWRVRGTASFTLLFVTASVDFDVTLGAADHSPPPPAVELNTPLRAALADPRNWSGTLPAGTGRLVSVRDLDPGTVGIHPLDTVTVEQRVVPLEHTIDRYGVSAVAGPRRFTVQASYGSAGPALVSSPVTDAFAPGQFHDYADDEKLLAPSFVELTNGVRFAAPAAATYPAARAVDVSVGYEEAVWDPSAPTGGPTVRAMAPAVRAPAPVAARPPVPASLGPTAARHRRQGVHP